MMAILSRRLPKAPLVSLILLSLCLSLCISLFFPSTLSAGMCINWPKVIGQAAAERLNGSRSVLVQPFTDYTKVPGDEWLTLGLRDYAADLLRTGADLKVLSGNAAVYRADQAPTDFTVAGTFQHAGSDMRVFIRLSDGRSGMLLAQKDVSFKYPENQDFFRAIAGATSEIMKAMGASPNSTRFGQIQNATASTRAYEGFAKGRQALEVYSPAKFESANIFFTEAKRVDYRSPLGYEGISALNAFKGLYFKQLGKPFSTYFQAAEAEAGLMGNLARAPSRVLDDPAAGKKRGNPRPSGRYLDGNAAYIEGLQLAQGGNLDAAAEALRRAAELVPEDAMAWYHLARIEAKRGDEEKSREALQRAYAINSCIEK
jgi:tetratricopeptide (TPR) repeat protein